MIRDRNFARRQPNLVDGEIYVHCNFAQKDPNTLLGHGNATKSITFRRCNMSNVKISANWTLVNCNTAQIVRPEKIPPPSGPEERTDMELVEFIKRKNRFLRDAGQPEVELTEKA